MARWPIFWHGATKADRPRPHGANLTKEVIKDASGKVRSVTMFWRVHDSDHRTTIMDVGSVSFATHANNQTLVKIHSAHRLGKNGLPLPNFLVKPVLRSFFADHVRDYRSIVTK